MRRMGGLKTGGPGGRTPGGLPPSMMGKILMPTSTPTLAAANPTVSSELADHLVHGNFWDPFAILGAYGVESGGEAAWAIRAFLPHAGDAWSRKR